MTDWMRRAACRTDPDRMWDDERVLEAKNLCSVCLVLPECAEWEAALTEWVPGVVAGLDELERAKSKKRCVDCGQPMRKSRRSSYCPSCKSARQMEYRIRSDEERWGVCPYCDTDFLVDHGNKKFCSDDHRVRFYRDRSNAARSERLRLARTG